MKAYRIELLIIDHDGVGEDIPTVIENTKFPNRCLHPIVKKMEAAEIGEWTDEHPLNNAQTEDAEYKRLFSKGA